ncbi:hypothetical protein K474DRAFT_1712291 [Panus rudis PR-1116 ss-1]|nr:hypothetical protein K474DRAFT_1712291 [Panus rudis PR-1116 ss-1]
MAQAHARPPENTVQVPGGTAPIIINVFQGGNTQLPAVVVEQKPESTKVVAILEGNLSANTGQSKQEPAGKVNGTKRQRSVPDVIEILDSDDEDSDKGKRKKVARPSRSVGGLNNGSQRNPLSAHNTVGPGGSTQPFGAHYGSGSALAWGSITYWRAASAPPRFASPARTATYTTSASVSRSSTPFDSATAALDGTATVPASTASTPVRQLSRSDSMVSTETTTLSTASDSTDATTSRASSDETETAIVGRRRLEPCPSVEV